MPLMRRRVGRAVSDLVRRLVRRARGRGHAGQGARLPWPRLSPGLAAVATAVRFNGAPGAVELEAFAVLL
jgi:hypothetical protein